MNPQEWRASGDTIEIAGHTIFFKDTQGTKPCLALLHGYPTSSWDWDPVWRELQHRFRLVALDFPGFGFSSRPSHHRYTIAEQAQVTRELLDALNITETHILAHDYGDTVAQELLAAQYDPGPPTPTICSVCFLNGGLFPETHRPRLIQTLLRTPLGPLLVRIYNRQRFAKSFSAVFGAHTQPTVSELTDFWEVASGNGGQKVLHKLLHYIPERTRFRERWVGAMCRQDIPIRFICGLDDPVSGAHMAARYTQVVPEPDVVELPGIGHYPQVEAAAAVVTAFFEFHDRLDTR